MDGSYKLDGRGMTQTSPAIVLWGVAGVLEVGNLESECGYGFGGIDDQIRFQIKQLGLTIFMLHVAHASIFNLVSCDMDFSISSGFNSDQTDVLGQKVNFMKSLGMKSGLSSYKT